MLNAYLKKLDCHLWYLSERLAVLSLFARCIPKNDKKAVAKALVKYRKSKKSELSMQQMPVLKTKTKLADLTGPDSWTLFDLLNADWSFLKVDPSQWNLNASYKKVETQVQSLSVVNDAAERALGLLTSFNTGRVTLDPEQHQLLLKMVSELRQTQLHVATSSERTTKKGLFKVKELLSC